jgi:leader peptidase (prepilin peptidase)/N-methyltransferase
MIEGLVIVVGLLMGSFLSVCIYRIPLNRNEFYDEDGAPIEAPEPKHSPDQRKITIIYPPRSFCPKCEKQLLWWHNIPVLSWLLLRGRCHFCKAPIPFRYPLVEMLSASAAILALSIYGLTPTALLVYLFVLALIVISFIDLDYYIIPDVISLPGTVLGLIIVAVNQFTGVFQAPVNSSLLQSGIGLLAGAGFLWFVAWLYQLIRKVEGLGFGDVKLLAMIGVLFGPQATLYTIFIGSLLGAAFGVIILLMKGKELNNPIPYGPYLASATILYLYSGDKLLQLIGASIGNAISGG